MRRSLAGLAFAGSLAACGSGGGFPDARPPDGPPIGGTFTLDWTVTDQASVPVACTAIGGQTVTVLTHNKGMLGGNTEVFTCGTGTGESEPFPPGLYDMDFELDGIVGKLATAPKQQDVTLVSGQTTALTPVAFAVDATGDLALHLDSGKTGGNCGATPLGAGITTTSITLEHTSDSSCAPLLLSIAAGATTMARAYMIDCTTPLDVPCIENDQAIAVAGIASDAYTIHVRGKIGASVCYKNDDTLQVPPLGMQLTSTLALGFQMGTAGC
jgi:hypothetical protein